MPDVAMKVAEIGPGAVCVEVSGEFDLSRAYAFDRDLQALETPELRALVIDLRAVSFVDSSGLARIMAASRRSQRAGRRFAIVRGSKAVERLLAMTALGDSVELVTDPSAVLRTG